MPDPGFPVFDADNHLYESPEMLTEYLPKQYARDIQFVQVRGRARIAVKGKITDYMPNPTFEKVAPPGAHVDFYRGTNTEGKSLREMSGQAIDCIPAFREPAPRLELLDELHVHRALVFPDPREPARVHARRRSRSHARRGPRGQSMALRRVELRLSGSDLHDTRDHAADRRGGDQGTRLGARAWRESRTDPTGASHRFARLTLVRAARVRSGLGPAARSRGPGVSARVVPAAHQLLRVVGARSLRQRVHSHAAPRALVAAPRGRGRARGDGLPGCADTVSRPQGGQRGERRELGGALAPATRARLRAHAAELRGTSRRGVPAQRVREPVLGGRRRGPRRPHHRRARALRLRLPASRRGLPSRSTTWTTSPSTRASTTARRAGS